MTFSELKDEVLRLSREEQEELLQLLLKAEENFDENWLAEMERRKRETKAGKKISREATMRLLGLIEKEITTPWSDPQK